jgi:hypothetical protein
MKAYVNVTIVFDLLHQRTPQEKNTGPIWVPYCVIKYGDDFQYTCLIEMRTLKSEHL